MDRVLIDFLGAGFEIIVVIIFYEAFWPIKKLTRPQFALVFLITAILNVFLTALLQNTVSLPVVSLIIIFAMSYCFSSGLTFKLLLSFAVFAIIFASEMLVLVIITQVLNVPTEQAQSSLLAYIIGVIVSKLFALFLVYVIRNFVKQYRQEADLQFNSLMALMPIQSILLCFIVYGYSVGIDALRIPVLGITAIIMSLLLVFITMLILNNQRKALAYKRDFDSSQIRLNMQIEHYQKLYAAQHEVRSIRHEISHKLLAISGMLSDGSIQEAIGLINGIHTDVERTTDIVNTGFPQVDAVIYAKINLANESGIHIKYKVIIDDKLYIDQLDLAVIIANAIDNAIEGIIRSGEVEKSILLHVSSESDYISILVENSASGPIAEDFKTSKTDKSSHGFGIAQMKKIALKYSGDVLPSFKRETGKFSLKILLNNRKL